MTTTADAVVSPRSQRPPRKWRGIAIVALLSLPAVVPLFVIAAALISSQNAVWAHLARYVLPNVIINTLILVVGVAGIAGILGTSLAWLTAMCEFPGRRWLEWALLLPLAIPAYVLAFVAVAFLDYSGPLQSVLRDWFGVSIWVPPIRSTGGVVLVLSLAFYPYVYLLARSAFRTQGVRVIEVAQTLGYSRGAAIRQVALPMAKPWIAAGIALVCMETLADFGAVAVFNYDTFTTAIYRAWFGMFSVHAALQLSAVLMLVVLIAVVIDRRSRTGLRFASARDVNRGVARMSLRPRTRWFAAFYAGAVFMVAFALPLLQLLWWSISTASRDLDARYWTFAAHSLLLAATAAGVIVTASLVLAYVQRRAQSPFVSGLTRVATLGYAVPGTVLAVGTLFPLVALNNALQDGLRGLMGASAPQLLLQGSLLGVLLAYMARFLAVGFNPVESGLHRVTRNLDEAAIGLGVSGTRLATRVHAPLLRTSLVTGAIMVFVDVMKEMPITLLTRPFGWDTLAVRVFNMTSIGEWERAALPAVAIVLVGLVPAAMLNRASAEDVA